MPDEFDTTCVFPATTANDLDDVISPPPDKPLPAVRDTELWSICSFDTKLLKLS